MNVVEQGGVFRRGRRQHLDRLLDVLDELLTRLPPGSVRRQGAAPRPANNGMLQSYQLTLEARMAIRKVAITLPEELFEIVERARAVEHRTRSELIQEALRTHFGEAVYLPSDDERRLLTAALDEAAQAPELLRDWDRVRADLRAGR